MAFSGRGCDLAHGHLHLHCCAVRLHGEGRGARQGMHVKHTSQICRQASQEGVNRRDSCRQADQEALTEPTCCCALLFWWCSWRHLPRSLCMEYLRTELVWTQQRSLKAAIRRLHSGLLAYVKVLTRCKE